MQIYSGCRYLPLWVLVPLFYLYRGQGIQDSFTACMTLVPRLCSSNRITSWRDCASFYLLAWRFLLQTPPAHCSLYRLWVTCTCYFLPATPTSRHLLHQGRRVGVRVRDLVGLQSFAFLFPFVYPWWQALEKASVDAWCRNVTCWCPLSFSTAAAACLLACPSFPSVLPMPQTLKDRHILSDTPPCWLPAGNPQTFILPDQLKQHSPEGLCIFVIPLAHTIVQNDSNF